MTKAARESRNSSLAARLKLYKDGWTFGILDELLAGLNVGLTVSLIISVGIELGCWSKSSLKSGVIRGSILGLLGGLITGLSAGSLNHIALVETISWNWNQFWKRTISGLIFGPIFTLLWGLLGLVRDWLLGGLFAALFFGAIFALANGLVGGLTDKVKLGKASPNQGIKLSRKNSLAVFLVSVLIWMPIGGLIGGPIGVLGKVQEGPIFGLVVGLVVSLTFGLIFGLIVGLDRGGSAVIKHYSLRLILWLNGYTPLNFIKFLDHCAKLIFLKKVGGGYIFIHRMLLDYFADLPQSAKGGDGKTRSVTP